MILNFINTNKVIATVSILVVMIGCFVYKNEQFYTQDERYKLIHTADGFELFFYSNDGEEIFYKNYTLEPNIVNIGENLYKISASSGVDSVYTIFINTEQSKISKPYFNLLFNDKNTVAFMENRVILLTDMFKREKIYKRIERDFSDTAVPQSAILSIKMIDNTIYLKYLKGEAYEVVDEEITIKKN